MNGRQEEEAVGDDEQNHLEKERINKRKKQKTVMMWWNPWKASYKASWILAHPLKIWCCSLLEGLFNTEHEGFTKTTEREKKRMQMKGQTKEPSSSESDREADTMKKQWNQIWSVGPFVYLSRIKEESFAKQLDAMQSHGDASEELSNKPLCYNHQSNSCHFTLTGSTAHKNVSNMQIGYI